MPPSWRAGLVNAFPIPDDKRKKRKGVKATQAHVPASTQLTTPDSPSEDTTPTSSPFPFLLLPPEIRTRIYHLILFPPPRTLHSSKTPASSQPNTFALLRASQQLHDETTHLLYTLTLFPLFHIQSFPPLPTPLLIPPRHRPLLKSLHLRLGNSWSAPPKSWRVSKLLARALPKFTSLKMLKVFVEVDPSEPMFEKYRISETFYTDFAGALLCDVLQAVPQVETVELGGYAFVDVKGPLVTRVVEVILKEGRRLVCSQEGGFKQRMGEVEGADKDKSRE